MEVFAIPSGNDTELGTLWDLRDSCTLVLKKINWDLAYTVLEYSVEIVSEDEFLS